MRGPLCLLLGMLSLAPCAQAAVAQAVLMPSADVRLATADSLYWAGRPTSAVARYDSMIDEGANSNDALWRAARAAVAVGWLDASEKTSIRSYERAQQLARRAVARSPRDADALLWLMVAAGRQAQIDNDPRTVVRRAREANDAAHRLLLLDSMNAEAHNFVGQLHYQVMKTAWPVRVIGLRLLGGVDFNASWIAAERHLQRAVALRPNTVMFHLELGRYYLKRGRTAEARTQLALAGKSRAMHPQDPLLQREAARLLSSANER